MKKLFTLLAIAGLILAQSTTSFAMDVEGKDNHIILVDEDGVWITFTHCRTDREGEVIERTCRTLGRSNSYRIVDLEHQAKQESIQAVTSGLVNGFLIAISGGIVNSATGSAVLSGLSAFGTVGTAQNLRAFNIAAQINDARIISGSLLSDERVLVNSGEKFASHLELILNKIDRENSL